MSNVVRIRTEHEPIDEVIVYEEAHPGGPIVKVFTFVGRIVEAVVVGIATRLIKAFRFVQRNSRSIGRWLHEVASDRFFRWQMRRISRKATRRSKERKSFKDRAVVFSHIRLGAVTKASSWKDYLSDKDGSVRVQRAKAEVDHRFGQTKSLLDDEAWKKHTTADRRMMKIHAHHGATIVRHNAPFGLVGFLAFIYRQQIPFTSPFLWIAVAVVALAFLRYFKRVGLRVLAAQAGESEDFTPTTEKIDGAHLERCFELIGVNAKCLAPGVIETADQNGWTVSLELQPTKPVKTVTDHVLTARRPLATVIGGIDETQLILTKGRSEDRVQVKCSYTRPSEHGPTEPPYASMQTVDTLSRIHVGNDALRTPITFPSSYAMLIVATSGTGKSELLYSYASPVALHPRGILLGSTFKRASNLEPLLNICNSAVRGDENKDRNALAQFVRQANEFAAIGSARRTQMEKDGISEVTPEMMLTDPNYPPVLWFGDEIQYPVDEHPEMRKMIMSLAWSIRNTGMKMVFAAQQLTKSVINQEFAQTFTTRAIGQLSAQHEVNALAGGSAISKGFDTSEWNEADKAGRFVLVGDSDGLKEVRAHHWTDAAKQRLISQSLINRGDFQRIDLNPQPQPTAEAFAMPAATKNDIFTQILKIRDEGTFGTKGVWVEEYPELCRLLGVDEKTLRQQLKDRGINPSYGFKKGGAENKRGFLFEHINNPTKEV
jgi:hypothetical protein